MPIVGLTTNRYATLGSMTFALGAPSVPDASGVEWFLEGLDGWDGSPASSLSLAQKLLMAGAWPSANPQLGPRAVTVHGKVTAPDRGTVLLALEQFKAACSLATTTLTVTEPGLGTLTLRVRRQGEVLAPPLNDTTYSFSVQMVAADPRKFGPAGTYTATPPSSSGGLTVPFTVPFTIPAVQNSGTISATNTGNISGPVTARLTGPLTGPVVTHTDTLGNSDVFAMAGYNIPAGQWVDVNMEAQTVLAQGQSERMGSVTSAGFGTFSPGANAWAFAVQSSGPGAQLSITATPARQ